jgi:hypothetical protein
MVVYPTNDSSQFTSMDVNLHELCSLDCPWTGSISQAVKKFPALRNSVFCGSVFKHRHSTLMNPAVLEVPTQSSSGPNTSSDYFVFKHW